MKLSKFKELLNTKETIAFQLPSGELVPSHFHVTEVGEISRKFIDCGGVIREEKKVNFQLWEENDYDHRLHPEKLVSIIELAQKQLLIGDHEIEVEYQSDTIGKFNLEYNGINFELMSTKTACLALDNCGIEKPKVKLSEMGSSIENNCSPNSGCC